MLIASEHMSEDERTLMIGYDSADGLRGDAMYDSNDINVRNSLAVIPYTQKIAQMRNMKAKK
jgi:hypothetical protein